MSDKKVEKAERTEEEIEQSSPFVIHGDGTLGDFLKYLEAVGVKTSNKAFFGQLSNQIRAYKFTCSGGDRSLWRLSSKLRLKGGVTGLLPTAVIVDDVVEKK